MEEYERRQRREREKHERQQVQAVNQEHSLFPEPRRVDPSEGDDHITSKLGEYSKVKDFIGLNTVGISSSGHRAQQQQQQQQMPPNAVQPGIIPGSASGGAPPSSSSRPPPSQQQPSHHYQQQQSRQPYLKQADNKPPYNGRGGYPGQPVKNDLRSSSGMAPPKGPPPPAAPSMLQPPSTTIMPNGRQSAADKSSASFLGPPAPMSSASTHNGRFSQPSIPKMLHKLPAENDITQILTEIGKTFRAPPPLTEIASTPRNTIVENYNLSGPNKHKYFVDPIMPPTPLEPFAPIAPLSALPASPVAPSLAPAPAPAMSRPKEPAKPLKTEKTTPTLEKQNSTLEHDLELSESDDERKKHVSSPPNSSESSQSDSSESGSEESMKSEKHQHQQQHQQQPPQRLGGSSATLANSSSGPNNKKKISQTITAGGGTTISGILSGNGGLGSAGSSCSGPSSASSSNKTPSPSDSNKWNLSRYFNKAATQQAQNDASPNGGSGVAMMLPGGAQIIPEPTPTPVSMASANASASVVATVKNETIVDDEDDGEDDDHEDDGGGNCERRPNPADNPASPPLANAFRHPAAFASRKPELSVTPLSPMKHTLLDEIKKESDALFPHQMTLKNLAPQQQHVPMLSAAEFVAIPTSQIKHEAAGSSLIAGGVTTVTPYNKRSPASSPAVQQPHRQHHGDDKNLAPELRKHAEEYMPMEVLSGLSSDTNSSDLNDAVTVPVPGPGGTLQIPGVPAAITALPRSPPQLLQKPQMLPNSLTVTLNPASPPPLTTAPVKYKTASPSTAPLQLGGGQRAKKPRKKLKQPPQTATADSSDEDGEYSVSSAAASASVSPAAAGGKLHEPLGADPSAPAAAATTTAKKGRGRPRKNTPNQSGNISSASSTTTKGPTLTAKKDVSSKKPTGRRRLSRQNSSSNAPSSAPVTPQVTPTKVHNAKQQQQAPAHKQRQPQQPQQKSSEYVASSEDSSSSSSSISTSKSSTSSSDSEEDSGSESSASDQKKQSRLSAAASAATSSSATSGSGRRIVKQLNKRKSSLDEVAPPSGASTTAAASGAKKGRATTGDAKESSSSSWSEESSDEEYSVNGANEQLAAGAAPTTYAPSAGGSYRQQNQSPMKVANSSRSRVSTSSSSMGLSTTSSSSGEDQSDSDCDVTRKEKKLRRDKPKSDKKKSSTLSKIFNPKECGAKKQGQVVIIDQSEELLAKEQHHMQQQQQLMQQQQHQMQQKHISPNAAFKSSSQENLATATATATTTTNSHSNSNSLHSSAIGTTTASQSPRLTPSHMKSPRNPLSATQHMITRTPDRCSASAERKLQQRIKTPTRTPTRTPPATRTPTPTQSLGATSAAAGSAPPFTSSPASSLSSITALICKIELSRLLHIAPEWHTNTYRLYAPVTASPRVGGGSHGTPSSGAGRTPIYDHETILNADLQATQLRLKPAPHAGSGGHTPNETAEHQQQRELSRSSESLVDPLSKTGKPRLEDVNTNGRASSRSVDGSGGSTPKDLPPPQAPPNGFTPRGLASTYGGASPSANKLMVGVKHEHIKYEPDVDGKPNAAAPTNYCADTKFKSGSVVKQELILKQDYKTPQPGELTPSDKQLMSVDPPASATVGDVAKPRRKRSSSSSSSPYKEKKRKKDKDKDKDREKDKDTALLKEKDKEKEKLNNNNNRTTMPGDIGGAVNHAQATEKELLLDQQLPPTNHDRLMDKQSFSAPASSPASHLQAATQAAVPAAHMPPPPPSSTASMLSLSSSSTAVALMEPGDKSSPVSVSANALVTPAPPQVIYRSYFERDEDALSDDFSKNTKFLQEAVNRKHAADREQNTFNQVTLYLEAVVYFLLSGAAMEQHRSSEEAAWTMYKDTLALIKFISSKFRHLQVTSSNGQHETHNKVAILSLRCQSLISLKLYKMKRNYCRTIITGCNDFFKSSKGDIVNGNTPSSISPSNSVCSQSSGSNTPPGKIVPQDVLTALMQQNQFFSYLTSSHDLWDQADRLVRQGNHTDFFIALDHENGPLTLHSSMYEVFKYVQAGLKKLKDAMSIQ